MRRLVILILVLVLILVFLWCNGAVRTVTSEASYPFQRTASTLRTQLGERFSAAWQGFCNGPSRAQANDELDRQQVMLRESARTAQENEILREALGWVKAQPQRVVAAPILSHGGGLGLWPRLTLRAGTREGIAAGDTVVAPEGLVGRIAENPSPHQSEVILLSDPASHVAVEVPGVAKGILDGMQGEDFGTNPDEPLLYTCEPYALRYLRQDTPLQPRQAVYTEGSGGRFPRGILVGHILEVRRSDSELLAEARVEPAVNPTLLQTVFVLTHAPANPQESRK